MNSTTPCTQIVRALAPVTADAFFAKFGRRIIVDMKVVQGDDGPTPKFTFRAEKPGLLPTKVESIWFEAHVQGYRACANIVLDLLDATAAGQVPS